MNIRRALACIAVALSASLATASAQTQRTPLTPAAIEAVRNDLQSADTSVRLAAVDRIVASGNPTLGNLLLNEGAVSNDPNIADAAAQFAFRSVQTIVPDLAEPYSERDEQAFILLTGNWGLRVNLRGYDPATGAFNGTGGLNGTRGSISGSRLDFSNSFCTASLRRVQGTLTYRGRSRCYVNDSVQISFSHDIEFSLR